MSTFGLGFSLGAVLGIALPAQPPATPQKPVTDTYYTVKVTDNYRWLENYSDQAVRKWSDDQNRYARRYLESLPARPARCEQFTELYSNLSPGSGRLSYCGACLFGCTFP